VLKTGIRVQSARAFRPSLHTELTSRLREMIMRHELRPGEWVPEAELCETLGVSRTPLREALKAIAVERLVILHPNRGATVADLLPEDVDHLFEAQSIIEGAASRLACQRGTDAEIANFAKVHRRMVRFFERKDRKAYFSLNQDLHRLLVAMSHNPSLIETHAGLITQIERARFLALDIGQRWETSMAQHDAILAALQARDGDSIQALVSQHARETHATVRGAVESHGNAQSSPVGVRRRIVKPASQS
jgi:DNA-binding GntR family transcriptional regulator